METGCSPHLERKSATHDWTPRSLRPSGPFYDSVLELPHSEARPVMRRLVIFVNGDFTLLENGSHIRMAEQIEFFQNHFPDIAVYSLAQHPSHPWTPEARKRFSKMFPDVELIVENAGPHLRLLTKIKNSALALAPSAASHILQWFAPFEGPRYKSMKANPEEFLFLINFVDGYTVLNGFPFESILETHDVRSVKHAKRYDMPFYSLRVLGKVRSEVAMLSQAGATIMISPVDRAIVQSQLTGTKESFLVPSFSDRPMILPPPDSNHTHDLLFVGANNNFNVDGLYSFLHENRDWLSKRSILVAGRVCEAPKIKLVASELPNLTLLGFVGDLSPIYASAKAVLSPVDGTGLKIKVVEALQHGKPVFGSAHSRDALPPGSETCVFPLDSTQIEALLDDPGRLDAAEHAVREYYGSLGNVGDRARLLRYCQERLSLSH